MLSVTTDTPERRRPPNVDEGASSRSIAAIVAAYCASVDTPSSQPKARRRYGNSQRANSSPLRSSSIQRPRWRPRMRAPHGWLGLRAGAVPPRPAQTSPVARAARPLRLISAAHSLPWHVRSGLEATAWRIGTSRARASLHPSILSLHARTPFLRTLATRVRSPTHARRKRNRSFLALGIAVGLGVAAYWTVPPFQLCVLGVQRCSRIGIAVVCDIIDYKLLFRKSVAGLPDAADVADRGQARRRRIPSGGGRRASSGMRTTRVRIGDVPSASWPS